MDTKPPYKQNRWKDHCRESKKEGNSRKIHKAMNEYGIAACKYEVIEDGFASLGSLALAEISYIQQFDSYKNGLNSSLGGDGLGHKNWALLTESEILELKKVLGNQFSEYNKKRWSGTTSEQRKKMMHCHSASANASRRATLIEFYKAFPEERKRKGEGIKKWQEENHDLLLERNKMNSLLGAAKTSKAIKVEFPDGSVVSYNSKSAAQRHTKQWMETLIRKTNEGIAHNGYKAWEI
jgi:hypothetical protein